ncbi:MAG: hypothetical protein HDS14_00500 [Bacteroides sp.]|nr:hypothetical protein [Bacteroides sp.]
MIKDILPPDEALAQVIDNRVKLETAENFFKPVRCYSDGRRPNTGLDDEFIEVLENGGVRARLSNLGAMKGSLLLVVTCKSHPDGTVKKNLIKQMIRQCINISSRRVHSGYIFRVKPDSVVMPTTTNPDTGYSTKAVNVEWRQL